MKKSLIALAAVAASGAAMAQSSVTLYGIADVAVVKAKGVDASLVDGGVSPSRWGLRGTEDLGGGLAVNFNFEQHLDLTDGTASGFDRQAWVGLSSGFGAIKLGKTSTAYDDVAVSADPVFDAIRLSPAWMARSIYAYNWNPASGVYYATPSFGGVSGAISTTFKTGELNDRISAAHVKYEGGPLFVAVAYQEEKNDLGDQAKYTRLVGTYDFGVAKLLAALGSTKDVEDDITLGVDVPLGSSLLLSTGLTQIRPDVGNNGTSFGLGVAYSLSKRTTAYSALRKDSKEIGDARVIAVGLKHSF